QEIIQEKLDKGYEEVEPASSIGAPQIQAIKEAPKIQPVAAVESKQIHKQSVEALPAPRRSVTPPVESPLVDSHPEASTKACSFGPRYFEMDDDGTWRFWEIEVAGKQATIRSGKKGTEGQAKTKSFSSEEVSISYAEEMIEEKLEQGYEEVGPPIATVTVAN